MISIQVNKDGALGRKELEKDRERKIWGERDEKHNSERKRRG